MTLETERLLLRPWKDEDAEDCFKYAQDPDVGPSCGWMPHASVDASLWTIRNILNAPQCYAVCLKETGEAIGSIELILHGVSHLTTSDAECELGYWIGKPFWGQGLIPEASRELMRYGFEELDMEKIWIAAFDGNAQSMRVQEKLGFKLVRVEEKVTFELIGRTVDLYVREITKEAFLKQN